MSRKVLKLRWDRPFKAFLLFWALLIPSMHISGISRSELDILSPHERYSTQILTEISTWNFYKEVVKTREFQIGDSLFEVEMTIDPRLQSFVEKIRDRNPSDYFALVILDNNTGNILALTEKDNLKTQGDRSIILSNTHPAASLIKVITSATLIENQHADLETEFPFVGRASTLYKRQLNSGQRMGARYLSLKKAFASSNNPVFGLAAIENLNMMEIQKMADNFGFNKTIMKYPAVGQSIFPEPEDQYNLAELASGLNTETHISLVHAATIPLTIANFGKYINPNLINTIYHKESNNKIKIGNQNKAERKVISSETASQLQQAMMETVRSGTASSSFKIFSKADWEKIIVGGKTGTITGGDPHGKHDWFVSFSKEREKNGKSISMAVLTVNKEYWFVKSSQISAEIIKFYFNQ